MQPAWVLGRRNYGDNGLLVELFMADGGRSSAVAKGVFRRKAGGSLASLLQPFHPLLVRLVGRGELKTLVTVESPSPAYVLHGDDLLSGLYLNELMIRVLPRFDPYPVVFMGYGEAIESLQSAVGEIALRRFELILLSELGYRIDWWLDGNQDPIQEPMDYLYHPSQGFMPVTPPQSVAVSDKRIPGGVIHAVRSWLDDGVIPETSELHLVKDVTRAAIAQLTQGRSLNSRAIFRSLRRPSAPRPD
jgi:DNA repair protein RecO (recombination protein O)